MWAISFVVIAATVTGLATIAVRRASDPVVRATGRRLIAVALAAFLCLRVLGFLFTAWLLIFAASLIAIMGLLAASGTGIALLVRVGRLAGLARRARHRVALLAGRTRLVRSR